MASKTTGNLNVVAAETVIECAALSTNCGFVPDNAVTPGLLTSVFVA